MKKILIIDDDMDMCALLSKFLQRKGFETEMAHSGGKGTAKFKEGNFDLVLCDFRLGDKEGKEVLQEIKAESPKTPVVIITGYSDIKTAVDVIKMGAFDYISKPLIPDEVLNVVNKALQAETESIDMPAAGTQKKNIPNIYSSGEYLAGTDTATKELYRQIELVAPTTYSVILYGESGTGKEVAARTIHEYSDRREKPFVAMDCGTLSKELAGSELFGHVKGSFTGALADKAGHFELANGGTLFLDEVGNLSYEIQAALLRVIQERKLKRVGGTKEMDIDIRIIVASNENLQQAYKTGKFREDLYHRFNEFSITIPPLRNRKNDIPLFAKFFLEKTNAELNKNISGFEDDVLEIFTNYAWPGNLREFRNTIRRAVLLTSGDKIKANTLPPEMINYTPEPEAYHNEAAADAPTLIKDSNPTLKNIAAQAEYETIMKVLREANYNKSKAAELLRIDRKTLYNKLKVFGIEN